MSGMVGLIIVGEPVNLEAVKAVKHLGKAKQRFADILRVSDSGITARLPRPRGKSQPGRGDGVHNFAGPPDRHQPCSQREVGPRLGRPAAAFTRRLSNKVHRPSLRKDSSTPAGKMAMGSRGRSPTGPMAQLRSRQIRTLQWVDWFNTRGLVEPIENIPSAEAGVNF